VAWACLGGIAAFQAGKEGERAQRAKRVAGLGLVEGCVSDAAIETLPDMSAWAWQMS
jgi:hypothetical protein